MRHEFVVPEVMAKLDNELEQLFFTLRGQYLAQLYKMRTGRLELKLENSALLGCDNYPECRYTKRCARLPIMMMTIRSLMAIRCWEWIALPTCRFCCEKALMVFMSSRVIRKKKPKRASLPKGTVIDNVELEYALGRYPCHAILARTPKQVI